MMNDILSQQIEFLKTIDALKDVNRASPILSMTRRENSAEHSWHLAMYALVLAEHADKPVNVGRVVQMLLLHDIVEVDAGDRPIHDGHDPSEQAALEQKAADRIFGLLPASQGRDLRGLWEEFEEAETADARFAKSLDRMQPLIQNVATDGGTWKPHALTETDVAERYGPQIEKGSARLWRKAQQLVHAFFA